MADEDPRREEWQLWELMQVFGPELYMGGPQLFKQNNVALLKPAPPAPPET